MALLSYFRLARAGFVLARAGALRNLDPKTLPPTVRVPASLLRTLGPRQAHKGAMQKALTGLGPSYVKFGQALATRPDIVGLDLAKELSFLQDRMVPFDPSLVPKMLNEALGAKASQIKKLSPPIAAASIAQVHKAELDLATGTQTVAIKILRPGIARRFARDFSDFLAGARLAENLSAEARRLRPTESLKTIMHSVRIELDLRFEAAAISRFSEELTAEERFHAPDLFWDFTTASVLTTNYVDAIPIAEIARIDEAGIDRPALAIRLLQSFLRQSIFRGYFHADMHPGNLFVAPNTGDIVAVDFGIMGQIGKNERRFLADILLGFINRDYDRLARRHFEMGYVPASRSVEEFALALRAIGEPLQGRSADRISMASVLGQLLAVTELFDMKTRPELLLLQKTMVMVEGVARTLDPALNIWTASKPVVEQWVLRERGPQGRIAEIGETVDTAIATARRLPSIVERVERLLDAEAGRRAGAGNSRWPAALVLCTGLIMVLILVLLTGQA